jgi:peptide/nickel transport system substrate-binding protein
VITTTSKRLAVATASLLLLTSCAKSSGSAGDGNEAFRVALSQPVQTLDVTHYISQQDQIVGNFIFDPLVGYDDKLDVVPRLAEKWEQVDPVTYEFTLRQKAVFSDGTPVTAEAVKEFLDYTRTVPKLKSWTQAINDVSAGDGKVTVKLSNPSMSFISALANPAFGVQAPASRKLDEKALARQPVGSGPYVLKSWSGDTITLERNDKYWGTAATQKNVVLTAVTDATTRFNSLKSGQYDLNQAVDPHTFAGIGSTGDVKGGQDPYVQSVFLLFNQANKTLSDPKVRQAMALALNVPAIVKSGTLGFGRAASVLIPPEIGGADKPMPTPDIDGAKKLLADAGHPDGLTIPLFTTNGRYMGDNAIAQVVQSQLAAVGVKVEITVLDYPALRQRLGQPATGLAVYGWTNQATPDPMLTSLFSSDSAINAVAYKNPDYDKLLQQAQKAPTRPEADAIWHQADQMLVSNVVIVPLFWSASLYGYRSNVSGVSFNQFGWINLLTVKTDG